MNLRSFAGNSDPLDFSHGLPGTCLESGWDWTSCPTRTENEQVFSQGVARADALQRHCKAKQTCSAVVTRLHLALVRCDGFGIQDFRSKLHRVLACGLFCWSRL
eukprot:s5157_g6.t2